MRIDVEAAGKFHFANGLVVVALNGTDSHLSGKVHALVGAGVVAHKVTQVQDAVRSVIKVMQHRLEGLNVGMDIRENRYPHNRPLNSAGDLLAKYFIWPGPIKLIQWFC
jgi:hypothetical protein